MKKILIIGMNSLIGSNLAVMLKKHYRVFGTYAYNEPRLDNVVCVPYVIGPKTHLQELIFDLRPNIVIYSAGMTDFQECKQNPVGSLYLNAQAPALIAEHLAALKGRLIFFSTAKVFSGHDGYYKEFDRPDPQDVYEKTKLRAEQLLEPYNEIFVLRLCTLYGLGARNKSSMLNRILAALWSGKETPFIDNEYRSFVSVAELYNAIQTVIEADPKTCGLYNIGHAQKHSYYSFAQLVGKTLGLPSSHLRPISGEEFNRSVESRAGSFGDDLRLCADLFKETFGIEFGPVEAEVEKIKQQLICGRQ